MSNHYCNPTSNIDTLDPTTNQHTDTVVANTSGGSFANFFLCTVQCTDFVAGATNLINVDYDRTLGAPSNPVIFYIDDGAGGFKKWPSPLQLTLDGNGIGKFKVYPVYDGDQAVFAIPIWNCSADPANQPCTYSPKYSTTITVNPDTAILAALLAGIPPPAPADVQTIPSSITPVVATATLYGGVSIANYQVGVYYSSGGLPLGSIAGEVTIITDSPDLIQFIPDITRPDQRQATLKLTFHGETSQIFAVAAYQPVDANATAYLYALPYIPSQSTIKVTAKSRPPVVIKPL